MQLRDLILSNAVVARLKVSTKTKLLREVARRAHLITNVDEETIFQALVDREDLGSTGVGSGVALPHARLPGLKQSFGMLISLDRPIEYQAIDELPVDLVGVILLPEEPKAVANVALACLARRLREPDVAKKLRAGKSSDELYFQLCEMTQHANSNSDVAKRV